MRRPRAFGSFEALGRYGSFVAFACLVLLSGYRGFAQGEVTDADLVAASEGRVVELGTIGSGASANVPIEQYVARVLAGEAEPNAPDGAMQALAIAIRTYAVFNADRHRAEGFGLCDSTHCQVPRAATLVTRRAAMATAGRILTFNGAPAEVFYSANCGGRSESASQVWPKANLPYLRSIEDDVHAGDVPWRLDLTLTAVQQALARDGFVGQQLRDVEVESRSPSGRVAVLRLTGVRPGTITGEQFRALMGPRQFRSTAFEVERRGLGLRFTGSGYGHGVGLCVIGAGRRARRGESVEGILGRYYPGLIVTRLEARAVARESAAESAGAGTVPVRTAVGGRAAFTVRVPATSLTPAADVERMAVEARASLSRALGATTAAPVSLTLHGTLESFRAATGKPWWVSSVASGTDIDLAPAILLEQRGGLAEAVRVALAELLVTPSLEGRPVWVRVGAARHFARTTPLAAPASRVPCPTDPELTLAVSVAAQRDADTRAEACFARELARVKDWRAVR